MNKETKFIIGSFLTGMLLVAGISLASASTAKNPNASDNPFSIEANTPTAPAGAPSATSPYLMQVNGVNVNGFLVNQKGTDVNSNTNYLQLYDYVNAWGRVKAKKGIWNVDIAGGDGFAMNSDGKGSSPIAVGDDKQVTIKKLLGVRDAKAGRAIDPERDDVYGTYSSTEVGSSSNLPSSKPGSVYLPFLNMKSANIRGIVVNQGANDADAQTSAIELYDDINIHGYTNVRDGIWNVKPNMPKIYMWFEAEKGRLSSYMVSANDGNASCDKYAWVPSGTGGADSPDVAGPLRGKLEFTVTAPFRDDYTVWARVLSPNAWSDSFFVKLRNDPSQAWGTGTNLSWTWKKVDVIGTLLQPVGTNLLFSQREDGTKIDKIVVTNDTAYTPSGEGESDPSGCN